MPSQSYKDRKEVYVLDFVHNIEINSSWRNLTDTAKLVFPKNVYVSTSQGNVAWADSDLYISKDTAPIFLRGDMIKIELGYFYKNNKENYVTETNVEFEGFITKINPRIPMEIECEDNMWLLKQAQCPNKVFPSKDWDSSTILQYLLLNSKVTADNIYLNDVIIPKLKTFNVINGVGESANVKTLLGDFRTQNETIAQVVMRLRKEYKIECFFRRTDLFVSGIVYYPDDYLKDGKIESVEYDFEENIISNEMFYTRKDDIRLGIKAVSVNKVNQGGTNSERGNKTKNKRLEVTVGDADGDLRTQFFWDVKTEDELTKLALQLLPKIKYEGWKGNFTSFILPFIRHGQAVSFNSTITPEREGIYLVKSVKVKFGINGARRIIEPHLRIDNSTNFKTSDFTNGL
jgi:hypothetical protein